MRHTLLLALLLLSALSFAQPQPKADAVFRPDINIDVQLPFTFDAYGDIRFTGRTLPHMSSPQYRRALVDRIAHDKPAFLLITGDLVLRGPDSDDWVHFDSETAPLRNAGVKIYPVLGNHELTEDPAAGMRNYFARFPFLNQRRWYSMRAANCVFFMLDSSQDAPASEQWNWLQDGLDHLPADIQYVFVVLHHPPVTRSTDKLFGGGHSARPDEQQLGEMLEKRAKTAPQHFFVLAGHVHNYERYVRNGVTYITTGGGGAAPYVITRLPDDLYREPGPTYHFCQISVAAASLTFQMNKVDLSSGKPLWEVKDEFHVNQASTQK